MGRCSFPLQSVTYTGLEYALSGNKELIKFADESTLLVPAKTNVSMETEFRYIQDWAKDNSMIINLVSQEIVLANVNSRSRSLFAVARPSVCRL